MNGFSYWESRYFWQPATYAVIGSGITGLTTAIFLRKKRPNARVVVLERGILPSGASTKNAGFACFGSMSEILDDLRTHSENEVFSLIARRTKGLSMLRSLLTDEQLGYEPSGGYEIFTEEQDELYKECLGALGYLNTQLVESIGVQAFREASSSIPNTGFRGVKHMLVNAEEGLIDTGLMMLHLLKLAREVGVDIYTGVEVLGLERNNGTTAIHTPHGALQADRVCVATNGFAARLLPQVQVSPCRAQVLITSPIEGLQPQGAFHHHYGYNYFRHLHGRILLGGGRHLDKSGEQTDQFGVTESLQSYLEQMLREVILPGKPFSIDQRWSGIMGMGDSKEVIVKHLGDGVYCAVRFGGMGVALGTAAGHDAAALMLE